MYHFKKVTLFGANAGYNLTTADNIVAIGTYAAQCMTTATDQVLVGTFGGGTRPEIEIPQYIRLFNAGLMKLDGMITNEFSLDDFGKAERLVIKDSTSKNVRLKFVKRSFELVVAYPFGVGIGNWQDYCNKTKPFHLLKHQYPHNLVLEVFAELGLIGGILLLLLLLKSLYLTYFRMITTSNANEIYSLLFYLQIFLFINSCFSGNLNDARLLFVVIAISLTKEPLIKENNA